jgi:hypothetical protein
MKIKLISLFSIIALPVVLFGTASISGTALRNVTGLGDGDFSVLLVDTSGSGFNSAALSTLTVGADLTSSSTYAGFEVLTTTTASFLFGSTTAEFNIANFDVLSQPIVSSDSFGILTFTGGSTTAANGTSFEIWTDATWDIPANSGAESFNSGALVQLDSVAAGSIGSVVPEPSTFAALAGLCALGAVMVRRRRA